MTCPYQQVNDSQHQPGFQSVPTVIPGYILVVWQNEPEIAGALYGGIM